MTVGAAALCLTALGGLARIAWTDVQRFEDDRGAAAVAAMALIGLRAILGKPELLVILGAAAMAGAIVLVSRRAPRAIGFGDVTIVPLVILVTTARTFETVVLLYAASVTLTALLYLRARRKPLSRLGSSSVPLAPPTAAAAAIGAVALLAGGEPLVLSALFVTVTVSLCLFLTHTRVCP